LEWCCCWVAEGINTDHDDLSLPLMPTMTMMILIHCSPSTLLELKFAGQRDIYIYREREREREREAGCRSS